MHASQALLAFCLWISLLTFALVSWRIVLVRKREFRWSEFTSGQKHGSDSYWRLNRVHANALENLAPFAVVVWLHSQIQSESNYFALLAWTLVFARVLQSIFHLKSGSSRAVIRRGLAFLTQQACLLAMLLSLIL